MVKPELLTYMKQVMDLETALYANQRLNDGLTECKSQYACTAAETKARNYRHALSP